MFVNQRTGQQSDITQSAVALALLLSSTCAAAQPEVDTSRWDCEYCPDTTGWQGWLAAGAGNVSDDSFKFGDYTGMHEEGAFGVLEGRILHRDEDGDYIDLFLDDLGLDSRSLRLEGGRQGRYDYYFEYDELPHYIDLTTQSPFLGTDNLQLPDGWVRAGDTADMTGLASALQDTELLRERETLAAGLGFIQSDHWNYSVDFQRQTRSGTDAIGGSFLNTATLLPMPIDYVTDQVDAALAFKTKRVQVTAAYYGSYFTNEHTTLSWDNPFSSPFAGADTGRLALAPSNDFHQLSLSAAYRFGATGRANAAVSAGEMTQNDPFPAATTNASLDSTGLPRESLDGQIDTLNYHLRLTGNPVGRLNLRFKHRYSERDNHTPRDMFQQIDSDILLSGLRTNIPYSFERSTTEAAAEYRLPADIELAAGAERDSHERTFQDVSETEDDAQWVQISTYAGGMFDLRLKAARQHRDASMHEPFGDIASQENPALRKFNLADRERDLYRAYMAFSPADWLSIGLTADTTDDDYSDSQIGLTGAEQDTRTVDISIMPTHDISVYLFGAIDEIDSQMAGSSNFSVANWSARQRDTVHTAGAGFEIVELFDTVDIGADYTHSRSRGEIEYTPMAAVPFPDLKTELDSAKLYIKYPFNKHFLLRVDYYKERYKTDDWQVDRVEPDTIPTALTLGQISPGYSVDVITTALEYRF